MKEFSKCLTRNFFKLSFICLVFLLSCGKGEVGQEDASEWYIKLGFKEVMEQMKKDTQVLTNKLSFDEFEEAERLCNKISNSFNSLDLNSPIIPKEFFEFKEGFDKSLTKLLTACKESKNEVVKTKLKAVKDSCRYCHKIFRKEFDRFNKETDHGVALERLFKDKKTDKSSY